LLCICRAFFFFSCRRRHTRFSRDWSSDVCSSDLGDSTAAIAPEIPRNPRIIAWDAGLAADSVGQLIGGAYQVIENADTLYISVRAEERSCRELVGLSVATAPVNANRT